MFLKTLFITLNLLAAHKRQIKRLKVPAYTQAEADLAGGVGRPEKPKPVKSEPL